MQTVTKVGLVGCVKRKRSYSAPAKRLYISDLFEKRRRYVERCYDSWVILSAKHTVVKPEEVLEPYDETLKRKSASERRRWASQVFEQLVQLYPDPARTIFYFHAGKEYREFLIRHLERVGYRWENPLKNLGIGKQLAWYLERNDRGIC